MGDASRRAVFTGDMAEVERLCGVEVAEAVSEILCGLNLYVPKVGDELDGGPLDKLEEDHAVALCAQFGGASIYVSRRRKPQADPAEVVRLLASGLRGHEVAQKLDISERHVYRLKRQHVSRPAFELAR